MMQMLAIVSNERVTAAGWDTQASWKLDVTRCDAMREAKQRIKAQHLNIDIM